MLRNILQASIRSLKKEGGYTMINILGLTLGITCSLFLLLYIIDEVSYDRYHKNARNLYRIITHVKEPTSEFTWARVQIPLADQLKDNYPEVKNAVRFFTSGRELFEQGNRLFYEENFYFADSTVFDMFTYEFLAGDPGTALDEPFTVVLTKSMAFKYFGSTDVLGKPIRFVDRNESYKVTGVMEDVPSNSHFHFDALLSLRSLPVIRQATNWGRMLMQTYIELPEKYNPHDFQLHLDEVVEKHIKPLLEKRGVALDYQLQRITDIHLYSKIQDEEEAGGDISFVYILSAIAAFMIIIACINYMNLATARAVKRAREVGVRKVMGSSRKQLVMQFMIEASILAGLALTSALVLVCLFLPVFNLLAGKHLPLYHVFQPQVFAILASLVALVSFGGGIYPAFYLSRFNPAIVLKSNAASQRGGLAIRQALVVVQVAISVFMVISTAVVHDQMDFLLAKDLGFNKDQVMRIAVDDGKMRSTLSIFKDKLARDRDVTSFATASASPGTNVRKALVSVEDNEGQMGERSIDWYSADYDFTDALGMTFVKGRNFSPDIPSDTMFAVLVNEEMVKRMNWEEPIGKRFKAGNTEKKVVGVFKNYHHNSLYNEIEPMVVPFHKDNYFTYIKLGTTGHRATVERVEKAWKEVYPGKPFEFQFLDQAFNKQYDSDERRSTILTIFSIIAVVIACLGLLGLTAYSTEQRAKEISIRKVIGATTSHVTLLIAKDFFVLVVIATLVAIPLVYWFTDKWLLEFAYRINLNDEMLTFVGAGTTAIFATMLTVGYHAMKAALANPVTALKSE